VDPVPDPLILRKSGSTGNRTRTSVSVAKNSHEETIEAVNHNIETRNKSIENVTKIKSLGSTLINYKFIH
jgi:hypothetical protein